jgi:hypothetical protein
MSGDIMLKEKNMQTKIAGLTLTITTVPDLGNYGITIIIIGSRAQGL